MPAMYQQGGASAVPLPSSARVPRAKSLYRPLARWYLSDSRGVWPLKPCRYQQVPPIGSQGLRLPGLQRPLTGLLLIHRPSASPALCEQRPFRLLQSMALSTHHRQPRLVGCFTLMLAQAQKIQQPSIGFFFQWLHEYIPCRAKGSGAALAATGGPWQ